MEADLLPDPGIGIHHTAEKDGVGGVGRTAPSGARPN